MRTLKVAPLLLVAALVVPAAGHAATNQHVEVTFYGAFDNDPPGSKAIAHPVIHTQAGGTGTFADPLTFSSPAGAGAYAWGTIIYVPEVQKYFIREDECATSPTAPNGCGATSHVDLYVGNPSNTRAVVACENYLTPDGGGTIIVDPPNNFIVDPTPIFDQSTGRCMTPHSDEPTQAPGPQPSNPPTPSVPSGSSDAYRLACAKVHDSEHDPVPKREPRNCGLWNGANYRNAMLTKIRWSSWGKTAKGRGKAIPISRPREASAVHDHAQPSTTVRRRAALHAYQDHDALWQSPCQGRSL